MLNLAVKIRTNTIFWRQKIVRITH